MFKRNVLITGTSKGLGLALAEHFLKRGDTVIGCARSESALSHNSYHHYRLDVTSVEDVVAFFMEIRHQFKVLDVLVNNAGIARMNAFAMTPIESVRSILSVNVEATFHFSQRAVGMLRKAEHPRIVNMSTVAVPLQLEGEAAYAASKSGVETLTRIMAKELGGFGITCNAVGPSPIETDLIKGVGEEKIKKLVGQQAVKTMATVKDVIHLVDFFCAAASGMISGQVVYLGGISG